MNRPLVQLVAECVAVARAQLVAARTLDADGLNRATQRRQDLQFELGLTLDAGGIEDPDADVQGFLRTLKGLDHRLDAVLGAATDVFAELLPKGPPPTYSMRGRLSARGH
jgi:hypothetical protein